MGEHAAIEFSSFTLDLRAGQLRCAGTPLPLRPKTWAVLVYLIQRPGSLVTKEELLDAVWPDVAVTPDTLNKSIGELRSALGDDIKQPRYIETVHRRGFRFVATPRPLTSAAGGSAAPAEDGRPFVGREAELACLRRCFERARAGERQLVFVSGPAGVGKTALVEAFLREPTLRHPAALVGGGASIEQHGVREAYLPVLEALERLAQGPDAARVVDVLRATAPSWLVQMPWLAGDDPALLQRSLQAARPERMLRECVALLETLAAEVPLVLALEDLHWSDPSTVDLLTRIGQRTEPARLLIVATYRAAEVAVFDHPLGAAVRALRSQRRGVELMLDELSAEAVRGYLVARFPGASPPPGLAEVLYAHTEGHPLFLRAAVDHMVARGWILDTAPGWAFDGLPALPDFGVPQDVRDMVALQIGGLGPADRRLLEVASVAGHDFAPGKLAMVLERGEDEVEAGCEALARGDRFLRPLVGGAAPRYAFAHELYRRAVYEEIPRTRRQRLHLRLGQALEARLGEQAAEHAASLAHHFEQGRDVERALHYLGLAAARARQRAGLREASEYLRHALALVAHLPDRAAGARHELQLLMALAAVLIELNGPASDALLHTCERALALCETAGDPRLRFRILYAICHVATMRGDAARLDALLAVFDELGASLGDAESRLVVDSIYCRTALNRAHFAACCRHGEAVFAAAAAPAVRPVATFGADPVIGSRVHYAVSAWMLGDVERARMALRTAESELTASPATPFTRGSVAVFASLMAMLDGDAERTLRASEAAHQIAEEYGVVQWDVMSRALHGWARIRLGDVGPGIAEIRDAQTAWAETGARIFSTYMLAFLAEGHLRAGDTAAGLEAIDRGLDVAETVLDRSFVPELWRLKGELLLARGGEHAAAEACLQRAIAVARASDARSLALRAALRLAHVWLADGRTRPARTLLADALVGFDPDADSLDLRQARALLAPPAGARARTAPPRHG